MSKIKKGIFSLLLVLTLMFGIAACSSTGKVNKQLDGMWEARLSSLVYAQYSFDAEDKTVIVKNYAFNTQISKFEGTYTISDSKIIIKYNSGSEASFAYSFDDDVLRVYFDSKTEMKKK